MEGYKVIGVKRYSFENRQSGEKVVGCKVSYLDEKVPSTNPNEKGYPTLEISCPYEMFDKFTVVPGKYDLNFTMKPGKNNKPVLELKDATYIHELDFAKK